jgi:hypothetical protein
MARIIKKAHPLSTPETTRGRCEAAFEFALCSSTSFMPDAKRKSTRVLMKTRRKRRLFSPCGVANDKRNKPSAIGKVTQEKSRSDAYEEYDRSFACHESCKKRKRRRTAARRENVIATEGDGGGCRRKISQNGGRLSDNLLRPLAPRSLIVASRRRLAGWPSPADYRRRWPLARFRAAPARTS